MNPIAKIEIENRGTIVVELLPEMAPNTVESFIYLADLGVFDNYAIQRIVPGSWVDCSYTAFGKDEAKYFVENEAKLQNNTLIKRNMMCVGGYKQEDGSIKIAAGEFYFPLRDCEDLVGKYPIIGNVLEGMDIVDAIAIVDTFSVKLEHMPNTIITTPVTPELIKKVSIELNGYEPVGVIKQPADPFPENWA